MTTKKPALTSLVQTAARRRCEELLDEIARRKASIYEAFVDIGNALVEIEKKERSPRSTRSGRD